MRRASGILGKLFILFSELLTIISKELVFYGHVQSGLQLLTNGLFLRAETQ